MRMQAVQFGPNCLPMLDAVCVVGLGLRKTF